MFSVAARRGNGLSVGRRQAGALLTWLGAATIDAVVRSFECARTKAALVARGSAVLGVVALQT
jgi:hypothetical protein